MDKKIEKPKSLIGLIGLLLLLFGIFTSVRTAVNLIFFKDYPTTGVASFMSLMGGGYYMGQREADCEMMSYPGFFNPDGQPREATEAEKRIAEQQKASCISGIRESRHAAKINDISSSLLFLFLGAGVLVGKKYI